LLFYTIHITTLYFSLKNTAFSQGYLKSAKNIAKRLFPQNENRIARSYVMHDASRHQIGGSVT